MELSNVEEYSHICINDKVELTLSFFRFSGAVSYTAEQSRLPLGLVMLCSLLSLSVFDSRLFICGGSLVLALECLRTLLPQSLRFSLLLFFDWSRGRICLSGSCRIKEQGLLARLRAVSG